MRSEKVFHSDFLSFLQAEFVARCRVNSRYSIRAFARALRTDYSTLSKILRGERKAGKKVIEKYSQELGCPESEIRRFMGALTHPTLENTRTYDDVSLELFHLTQDWYYFAIVELTKVKNFKSDPTQVARKLGISPTQVQIAVEQLQKLGYIAVDDRGEWRDATSGHTSAIRPNVTSKGLREHQRQVLALAMQALDKVPISLRDQSSMTMAIDRSKLEAAKEKIRQFRREMDSFLSTSSNADDVYNLCISLYPLTVT